MLTRLYPLHLIKAVKGGCVNLMSRWTRNEAAMRMIVFVERKRQSLIEDHLTNPVR